jgi:lipid II:glycine glycyltransferase (peptidoglycan interpeptide bridge formation enzyme)
MTIVITQDLVEEEWRRFVDAHPRGNVFHTPEMFEVFRRAEGHRPELWAATKNGQISALLTPVYITLKAGVLRFLTTRAVVYGSVLCDPGMEDRDALARLLHAYKHNVRAPLFTELRNLSDLGAVQPVLQDNGFVHEGHLNFLIDLQRPSEEIWSSLDGNVRTNVRKARRMNVVVEEITSLDKVPAAYALLANVYERIQIPLAPLSLFETAFEILYPKGMLKIFMACVDDTHIGVAIRLLYKDVIYAWYAGAIREYASYKANDLLNWHVLEWGTQHGFKCFDFGGAGKPDQDYGPRRFKAKFNGTLVNYGRNVCVHHPLRLRVSQWGYQIYRHFM